MVKGLESWSQSFLIWMMVSDTIEEIENLIPESVSQSFLIWMMVSDPELLSKISAIFESLNPS